MLDILESLAQWLESGQAAALAAITFQSGSTPRGAGATMAVRADGRIAGTIGGGLVEAQVMRSCTTLLARNMADMAEPARLEQFDLENTQAAQAGMICGGRLEVFERAFAAAPENAAYFRRAREALRAGKAVAALFDLAGPNFLMMDGVLDPDGPLLDPDLAQSTVPQRLEAGGRRLVFLPFAAPDTAVLVGAGHVAQHTAKVLALVGFRVVVMDDREDFANRERFPDAAEVIVLENFDDCLSCVPVTPASALVILTRGHLHDKTVLAQALTTPAGYIGMIGSRKKRDATYAALLAEGVEQAAIDRVHCPIGLEIAAQTPEEIAVSITAEMIQDRAKRREHV